MEACRAELTISPDTLAQKIVWMAEDGGVALGCAALKLGAAQQGEVSMFFVDPNIQWRGVGRMLWTTLFRLAHKQGLSTLELDADPNAVGFYEKQGFVNIGTAASASTIGRLLPRMQLSIR